MARFDATDIRRYYDRQTPGFVALGQGGGQAAIHRAVWGPGVTRREQAFHYVEDRIADLLVDAAAEAHGGGPSEDQPSAVGGMAALADHVAAPHVVDLGCGVGGSLAYLARRLPIRGTGITLSPVQARLAAAYIRSLGLTERVACIEGDYTRLPDGLAPADLAFAIESFVHGPSPQRFFAESARLVKPGGRLVVCDDFSRFSPAAGASRAVEQFRRGWRVNTLLTRDELVGLAAAAGFAHEVSVDLTPWLELGRPRDRAIAAFVSLFGWLPLERTRIAHVVGGSALQACLKRGWIGYDLICFRRHATSADRPDR